VETLRNRMAWHPWVLAPLLSAGALGWLPFLVRGIRQRSAEMYVSAAVYFAWIGLIGSPLGSVPDPDDPEGSTPTAVGSILLAVLWIVSTVHTAKLRWTTAPRGTGPAPQPTTGVPALHDPGVDPAWLLAGLDRLRDETRAAAALHAAAPPSRRIDAGTWRDLETVVEEVRALVVEARDTRLSAQQFRPVEQMATDYLPSSIRTVAAIHPRQLLTDETAARADAEAREIAAVLRTEVAAMAESVYAADFSRLEQQRRFLAARFHRSDDLQL
jgi:hypothetical protein